MTDKTNKNIIYIIVALAIFGLAGIIGLTLFFTSSVSKDVSFSDWLSASKKISDDANEMDSSVTFQSCPTDQELSDFFKLHRKEFDLMNTMFIEDKFSSLNFMFACDKDNRTAMYPYVEKLDLGKDAQKAVFAIPKKRFDKYRELMKACKVDEIYSQGESEQVGVSFNMYGESLQKGKEPDDADFFKRKGISYWLKPNLQTYDSTDDIIPEDNYTYGAVKIDSEPHWFLWLWMQKPPN